jgi:hypothetical protein
MFGPQVTFRLLGVLPLLLLPLGLYVLLRATAPEQRGWSLVGVLLSFTVYYLQGLLSYVIGLALTLFWLAFWWPRRTSTASVDRVALAFAAVLLYSIHLSAPLIVIGVVWLDYVHELALEWRTRRARPSLANPRLQTALAISMAVAATWAVSQVMTWRDPVIYPVAIFRPWLTKVRYVTYPLFAFSAWQFALLLAGYATALLFFGIYRFRGLRSTAFLWCGPAFVFLYLISPANSAADVRWLPVAYLLPFCAPGPGRRVPASALVAMFLFCVAHAGIVHRRAIRIDRELDGYDAVLARLPHESRVLPTVSDQFRDGHVRPYYHFALWLTITKNARVAGLFTRDGAQAGQETWRHFDHFRLRHPFYSPSYEWGSRTFEPLDCAKIRTDYDVVIQAGREERAASRIRACAREEFRTGEITVYRVTPSATGE